MNRDFLKFQFKSRKYLVIFLFVVQMLVGMGTYALVYNSLKTSVYLSMGLTFMILMIATTLLTPYLFSFIQNKRSVDTYFSLPISRKGLLLNNLIFLFIILFGSWLLPNIISFAIALCIGANFLGILAYFGIILLVEIGIVLFFGTVYLLANNAIDGVIMIIAYSLLPLFLTLAISLFQSVYIIGYSAIDLNNIFYLSVPVMACNMFFEGISLIMSDYFYGWLINSSFIDIIIYIAWTIFFGFGLYHLFTKRKAENAEQNSNHFLAYPSLIYFYTFILLFVVTYMFGFNLHSGDELMVSLLSSLLAYSLVFIFFMVAQFVYRRKIFISSKVIIFFVVTVILTFAFSELAYTTKGFGLSYAYIKDHEYVTYSYRTNVNTIEDEELKAYFMDYIANNPAYNDYEYYDESYIGLEFDIAMDKKDIQENQELYNLLEELRIYLIEDYYNQRYDNYDYMTSTSLIIYDYEDAAFRKIRENYYYNGQKEADAELIRALMEYDRVDIRIEGMVYSNTQSY